MPRNRKIRSLLPFLFIFVIIATTCVFAYFHPVSWSNLKIFQLNLKIFSQAHPFLTPLLFMSIYILYSLLSLPGIFILSLFAGSLFTQPFSTIYVIVAATIGASLLFLAARTAFGQIFCRKAKQNLLLKMEEGFQKNAASYLLFLRLIPLFPFWLVNIAGAFFSVPFWTFAWTTLVGMIPSVFIYTQAGKGITLLLHSPDPFNPMNLFNTNITVSLCGLALLSLLPVALKYFKINYNK